MKAVGSPHDPLELPQIVETYPLSPLQEGMLFHSLAHPGAGVDIEQLILTFRNPCADERLTEGLREGSQAGCSHAGYSQEGLDVACLRAAWQLVVERHPVLRTAFRWDEDVPRQQVVATVALDWSEHDLTTLPPSERTLSLERFLREDRTRGFDLQRPSLMRLTLFRCQPGEFRLVWSFHHAILDGRSFVLVLREVLVLYRAHREGTIPALPPPRPYRDYIDWLQQQEFSQAEAYWRAMLAGLEAGTSLAEALPTLERTFGVVADAAQQEISLPEALTADLTALAARFDVTPNTLLQGAWAVVLGRYTGRSDVVFGATRACRKSAAGGADEVIGLLINTLPFRIRLPASARVCDWLQELRAAQLAVRPYEHTPLAQIGRWWGSGTNSALFDTLVVFENFELAEIFRKPSRPEAPHAIELIEKTNYPLTVCGYLGERLRIKLYYDPARIHPDAVTRLLGQIRTVLEGFVAAPEGRLGTLPLLPEDQRHQLLVEWNATAANMPCDGTIHQRIEEQVHRVSEAVAVVCGAQRLTYGELNARANLLAQRLRHAGVGPGALVGLCVGRSPNLIVGLLGILKAGGAYVPLDPEYPRERLAYMLADCRAEVLLTQATLQPELPTFAGRIVVVDADSTDSDRRDGDQIGQAQQDPGLADQEAKRNPFSGNGQIREVEGSDPAYVIYTSGSTGHPKGVIVTHHNLVHSTLARRHYYRERPTAFLLLSSYAFDSSIAGIFWTLCEGGRLILPSRPVQEDLHGVLEQIANERVSHYLCVPSVHQLFLEELPSALSALRSVIVAGEECPARLVGAHQSRLPHVALFNEYGPTEATVWASVWKADAAPPPASIPIGRPIANTALYVLDPNLQPVPIGVSGELYIGGDGLTPGYLHRPDLTADRYVPDPFSRKPGGRLYRTGDLVRYAPDSNLEFLGRIDHQVKIRGHRIELGEIESELARHERVEEAIVAAREDEAGAPHLVAYVVARDGALSVREMREHLRRRLPASMLPSILVNLKALPRTPNGKVDREALPTPEWADREVGPEYEAARTPVEERLADIWSELLRVPRVGIHDSFFELGGHSLVAMQVISRIRGAFGVELPIQALFDAPTLADLAERVATAGGEAVPTPPLLRSSQDGPLPLSFAQQRLWFVYQLDPADPAYNVPCVLKIEGSLSLPALQRAIEMLVVRHAVLRTTYIETEGVPAQIVAPATATPLAVIDLSAMEAADETDREREALRRAGEECRAPFDLRNGPLLRAVVYCLSPTHHLLALTTHHIASDGWSVALIVREITALYEAALDERPPDRSDLPELPVQYTDYALWQRRWLETPAMREQFAYWQRRLDGAPKTMSLPPDRPRPRTPSLRGATLNVAFGTELTEGLRAASRREGATLFMGLLACFYALLYDVLDTEDLVVGTDVAGRNRSELEGLVGFFINHLVLRADLAGNPTLGELVRRVREMALDAYAHQDLPFDRLVEALQPERDPAFTPLFQLLVVMQNALEPRAEGGGLVVRLMNVDTCTSKYDLALFFCEIEDSGRRRLRSDWVYRTDLFDAATIRAMAERLETVAMELVAAPQQRLSELKQTLAAADVSRRQTEQRRRDAANYSRFQRVKPQAQSIRSSSLEDGR